MSLLVEYLNDFSHLIFPYNCHGCGAALDADEHVICYACIKDLPLTKYWTYDDNPIEHLFWGKIRVERAASFLFFREGNVTQRLIHQLKYKGKTEIGKILGKHFGEHLSETRFAEVDAIIPVPLHKSKLKKRGYNQCDSIAEGLNEALGIEVYDDAISRLKYNESQTKKGAYDRWINVKELFRAEKPELLENKHLLFIDDVITTGSTLEACIGAALAVPGVKVSVATLASPAPY